MEKLIFSIVFIVFSMFLSNELSIVNAQQENIQEDKYSKTTTTNLTQILRTYLQRD